MTPALIRHYVSMIQQGVGAVIVESAYVSQQGRNNLHQLGISEEGETPEECMARELKEELDIEVEVRELNTSNKHKYPHGIFELLAYCVKHYDWRATLAGAGVLLWCTVIPLAMLIRDSPESQGYLPDGDIPEAVSYTHLTLPTNREV